jgi:hypothetical protein
VIGVFVLYYIFVVLQDIDALAGELQKVQSHRHSNSDAVSSQVRSMESKFENALSDITSRVQRVDPSGLKEQLRSLESKVGAHVARECSLQPPTSLAFLCIVQVSSPAYTFMCCGRGWHCSIVRSKDSASHVMS